MRPIPRNVQGGSDPPLRRPCFREDSKLCRTGDSDYDPPVHHAIGNVLADRSLRWRPRGKRLGRTGDRKYRHKANYASRPTFAVLIVHHCVFSVGGIVRRDRQAPRPAADGSSATPTTRKSPLGDFLLAGYALLILARGPAFSELYVQLSLFGLDARHLARMDGCLRLKSVLKSRKYRLFDTPLLFICK